MRLIATASAEEGAKLGKAIYNSQGQILLNKGAGLTQSIISRLLGFGIDYVYIDDPDTEDIAVNSPVSDELRIEAYATIQSAFKQVANDIHVSPAIVLEKSTKDFKRLIRCLISELNGSNELLSLLSDVFIHDQYIFSHSLNVTLYTLAIGLEMKLNGKDLESIGLGAILHDVGKMNIPREILLKPGRLTLEEYETIKAHAEDGFEILRSIQGLPLLVSHCAYQHHERMDGTGYPRGLKGEEIHLFGKILGVADVFDAVTSNRVYRNAMLPHEGLEILYAGYGSKFNAAVIDAFKRAVVIYPAGLTVQLSNGKKGVVSSQHRGISDRPTVRVLEEHGMKVAPYEIDLSRNPSIVITECDTTFRK
ncbi:HD-GYP domain-containing protein [Mesobacillus zeae]|uniref:HD-GYP domain-containing protein n=1 Tax=Mesobacillus zeae TaxID=1917180 RepID=A0A398BNG1_9BACI|nr:HD-GYP domain-containing protein [Mesobacillus zeae]RID88896.1 HD-GYP domain-containing protein [Mesobacillus zeae]